MLERAATPSSTMTENGARGTILDLVPLGTLPAWWHPLSWVCSIIMKTNTGVADETAGGMVIRAITSGPDDAQLSTLNPVNPPLGLSRRVD